MLTTNMRNKLDSHITNIIETYEKSCISVYADDGTSKLKHIGTALLLQINNIGYILTAAHIIDESINATLYIPTRKGINQLTGEFYRTRPAPLNSKIDEYDFAFKALSPEECQSLKNEYSFIQTLSADQSIGASNLYLALGYPNSKNKPNNRTAHIQPTIYPYINSGHQEAHHIYVKHDKYGRVLRDGTHTHIAQLRGMSGGAIISINKGKKDALLSGLITMKKNGYIVGTQIHIILDEIGRTMTTV